MNRQSNFSWRLACILLPFAIGSALAEPGDKIVAGDMFPPYQLGTMAGPIVESSNRKSKVTVLIYVVANQHWPERAIADASKTIQDLDDQSVELLFVTADADQSEYFLDFWKEKGIKGTLAYDPDRKLYADLGLIAFPSTMIIGHEGRLAHVLTTHSPSYPYTLNAYIRHALGTLDDAGLKETLKARSSSTSSPKNNASRHRAVARMMLGKGLYEAAEKELLKALELNPDAVDARLDLAELYLRLDRDLEASDLVEQVQKINAENRRSMLLKGILYFHKGNTAEAEQWLSKSLLHNPDPARSHYYLGRVNESIGNKDEALEHYRRALVGFLDEPID
ncbi:MAG: tetratricopeptide repeat protein [Phycisphaerales bacterium]|nr:tetratricopeptide repeat protein [Phycisphaerales bacterium]